MRKKQIILIPKFSEENGTLCPIEFNELPFEPKRIYYIKDIPILDIRGQHAHRETEQILICIQGEIDVYLYDGKKTIHHILHEDEAVFVPKMIWDSQQYMTGNDILLSIASTHYDINDYITDIEEFQKIKND